MLLLFDFFSGSSFDLFEAPLTFSDPDPLGALEAGLVAAFPFLGATLE